jgi:lantibiotic biosynthesis protein
LYFRIYCGYKSIEKVLKEIILPFVRNHVDKSAFEKFFFIRYGNPSPHIRIRFYNSNTYKQYELQKDFLAALSPLLEAGIISRIEIHTYTRELERYGNSNIDYAESIFFYDSLCVLNLIDLLEGGATGEKYRILLSLRGIDMFLADFKLSSNEKQQFAKALQSNYFNEFSGGSVLRKSLNDKYRIYQKDICSHLNAEMDVDNEIEEAVSLFNERSFQVKPVVESILNTDACNGDFRFDLIGSFIHMFINRLFIARQREYELALYHFLEKYYSSKIFREKSA